MSKGTSTPEIIHVEARSIEALAAVNKLIRKDFNELVDAPMNNTGRLTDLKFKVKHTLLDTTSRDSSAERVRDADILSLMPSKNAMAKASNMESISKEYSLLGEKKLQIAR